MFEGFMCVGWRGRRSFGLPMVPCAGASIKIPGLDEPHLPMPNLNLQMPQSATCIHKW